MAKRRGAATIYKITTEAALSPGEALSTPTPYTEKNVHSHHHSVESPSKSTKPASNHNVHSSKDKNYPSVDPDELWYHGNLDPHKPEKHYSENHAAHGHHHHLPPGFPEPDEKHKHHGGLGEHHHHHHHHHEDHDHSRKKPATVLTFSKPEYKPIPKPGSPDDPHIQMLILSNLQQQHGSHHYPTKPMQPVPSGVGQSGPLGGSGQGPYGNQPNLVTTSGGPSAISTGSSGSYMPPITGQHIQKPYPKPQNSYKPPVQPTLFPYPSQNFGSLHGGQQPFGNLQASQQTFYPTSSSSLFPWGIGGLGSQLYPFPQNTLTFNPAGSWGPWSSPSQTQVTRWPPSHSSHGPWGSYWRSEDSEVKPYKSGETGGTLGYSHSRSKLATPGYTSSYGGYLHRGSGVGPSTREPYRELPSMASSSDDYYSDRLFLGSAEDNYWGPSSTRVNTFAPIFGGRDYQV